MPPRPTKIENTPTSNMEMINNPDRYSPCSIPDLPARQRISVDAMRD